MTSKNTYFDELKRSAEWMAAQSDRVIFIGQAIEFKGTGVTRQLVDIPSEKKLELPVAEDFQAGFAIGMALEGYLPISVYPRWNFALLAANQIVNHLDKWGPMSDWESRPKVIIKVVVGSVNPLDPGHQHKQNCTEAFRLLCQNIEIIELLSTKDVFPTYQHAYSSDKSSIIVEHGDLYNSE